MTMMSKDRSLRIATLSAILLVLGLAVSACKPPKDSDLWHRANSTNPTGTGDFGPLDDPNTPGRSVLGPGG